MPRRQISMSAKRSFGWHKQEHLPSALRRSGFESAASSLSIGLAHARRKEFRLSLQLRNFLFWTHGSEHSAHCSALR
jgi:hypothetical protein